MLPAWGAAVTSLDPAWLGLAEQAVINRALAYLACFVALALAGTLALVISQAILPSYAAALPEAVEQGGSPVGRGAALQRVLAGTVAVAAVLAGWALLRGLGLAQDAAEHLLPRTLI